MFTLTLLLAFVLAAVALPLQAQKSVLEEFATFPKQQVTGVTVSPEGRVFVNFPFWSIIRCRWLRSLTASRRLFPMRLGTPKVGRPKAAGSAFKAWSLMTKGRFGF